MSNASRVFVGLVHVLIFSPLLFSADLQTRLTLSNPTTKATFGPKGLVLLEGTQSKAKIAFAQDDWSLAIDSSTLGSHAAQPRVKRVGRDEIQYDYGISGYEIRVIYQLKPAWRFVGKQLRVLRTPASDFTVHRVVAWDLKVQNEVGSAYVPSTYVPQLGATIAESRKSLPGKDFGEFLRLTGGQGLLLTIQNPFLEARHDGQTASLGYAPEMSWRKSWGQFASDMACIGTYSLSGRRLPRQMTLARGSVSQSRSLLASNAYRDDLQAVSRDSVDSGPGASTGIGS